MKRSKFMDELVIGILKMHQARLSAPQLLPRGLRLLIDNGARGIGDASLGTLNPIFLALKCLELDRLMT